jgi:putative solute:sodium symporter small subunit
LSLKASGIACSGAAGAAFRDIQARLSKIAMPESRVPPAFPSRSYWRRNLRLIALLLALWAGLTFIPSYFARGLSFDFLNWPFSYWMAAYGAPLAYLIIIAVYAGVMNRADRRAELEGDR